ncbi:MAG: PHB depolymerase family esterase [Fulvimonas sp.]|nr:PHB depolymerase family esterase [Fulvimonas sp.]
MTMPRFLRALAPGLLFLCGLASAGEAPPLPSLKVDASRVAVAGLSSGAYMATQAQLAYPELFHAAALVAGGPYGCAEGDLKIALTRCMKGQPPPDVRKLVDEAKARSAQGRIGPLDALAGDRVYVLHGRLDTVVAPTVAHAAAEFYRTLRQELPALSGLHVSEDAERPFAHNLPVVGRGEDCEKSVPPFLGHCGFDAAGAIFAALYGKPPHEADTQARGELRRFDQNALRPDGADAYLADEGYVYLPPSCLAGARCGVLVALHGCKQNAGAVGQAFVRDAGFNRWADAYDVAVIYPQTRASLAPLNPQACWDWWGYSGADYDTRQGVQLRWLRAALQALGGPAAR